MKNHFQDYWRRFWHHLQTSRLAKENEWPTKGMNPENQAIKKNKWGITTKPWSYMWWWRKLASFDYDKRVNPHVVFNGWATCGGENIVVPRPSWWTEFPPTLLSRHYVSWDGWCALYICRLSSMVQSHVDTWDKRPPKSIDIVFGWGNN